MPHIVSFLNSKGGVGKTTLSMLTGLAAHQLDTRVHLIDSDPQRSLTTWARMAETAGEPLPVPITPAPSPTDITRTLRHSDADLSIIDTPPGAPAIIDAAIGASDLMLVPTTASELDLHRLNETLTILANVPHAVVLNNLDLREAASTTIRARLEASGVDVAGTTIPARAAYRHAFGTHPNPVPAVYRQLAEEILTALN